MTPGVHPSAAVGFGAGADAYERGRPSYPPKAVTFLIDVLDLVPGKVGVDLGAGSGKLTGMLAPSGADLVAIEPVEAMQAKLMERVPSIRAARAIAEALPLRDGFVDAVVAAQSFHWFDGPRALAEIHRVLRPGGRLAIVWNVRDESVGWVRRLTDIMEPHRGPAPSHRSGDWRRAFDRSDAFGPLRTRTFPHRHRQTLDGVVERIASVSFIAALPTDERACVLGEVRQTLERDPQTRGSDEIAFPYRTEVHWCARA